MDPFLEVFDIWVADNESASLSVTLIVDGQTIQGNLASAKLHQKELTDALINSRKKVVQSIGESLRSALEEGQNQEKTQEQLDRAAEYIHLIDAEVAWAGGTCKVGPLRIRKEAISAWTLGRVEGPSE